MSLATGVKGVWCSLLRGETQCREMHDSAHWKELFGVIESHRSAAHGGVTKIPVCHALEVENEQAEQREGIQLGMLNAHLGRKLDLSVMIKEWYSPIYCSH